MVKSKLKNKSKSKLKVAVGCQGGGAHAAFGVGVLAEILRAYDADRFDLVGLSGTSAGALCALMTWYGLVPKRHGSGGSPKEAINMLEGFWDNFAASKPAEIMLNAFAFRTIAAEELELPIFGINAPILGLNPAGVLYRAMTACLPSFGVRKQYFDFRVMLDEACPQFGAIDWDNVKTRLLVGASEVLNGIETVFDSDCNKGKGSGKARVIHRWRQRLPLSLDGVAASGTLPILREAERIGGEYYWDGLYSQNPPVRELIAGVDQQMVPDELWIIRINPQQWPAEPKNNGEIQDRMNELMGNLSLNKELDFILTVNAWNKVYQDEKFAKDHKQVTVRTIKMEKTTADEMRYCSKFDRSHEFMNQLRGEGRRVAKAWLEKWPNVPCYPEDAGY